jgi:glycosyltransferase involved in cell wall biosynthesis
LLGQISPHKGHDDALEAMRLLGDGYRLLIAGKGDTDYVEKLKEKARGLPVTFSGFVELPEFFSAIDVLLVPSWEEPFGIVLLEAMASGIPVISTAAGGPLDIVRNGENGLLVPPKNAVALADAVRHLSADASLRSRVIQNARDRVKSGYDIGRVVPQIEKFYLELAPA